MIWLWGGFLLLIVLLLALDLGVFHRKSHAIGSREALLWTAFWVAVALAFGGLVYAIYEHHWFGAGLPGETQRRQTDGMTAALEYLTGYLIEKSLSLDNIFVIAVVIRFFRIRPEYQHRLLFWGILGAILTRGALILVGVWLVVKFEWIFYVFGALLVWTGLKMAFGKEEKIDPTENWFYRLFRRMAPVTAEDHGPHFLVRTGGRVVFTMLMPALIVIEATDVMFAIDSIPAIFAITTDPFIVMTSNIFAILGLRSLYFVLANAIDRFRYLKTAVAALLIVIGAKMLLHELWKPPVTVSLLIVGVILTAGIIGSIVVDRRRPHGGSDLPDADVDELNRESPAAPSLAAPEESSVEAAPDPAGRRDARRPAPEPPDRPRG